MALTLMAQAGAGSTPENMDPAPEPTDPAYPAAHFKPPGGWVGDVHPFHWKDHWWMAYLEVPTGPMRHGLHRMVSAMATSKDLIHWEKHRVTIDDPERDWWLIAMLPQGDRVFAFYNGAEGIDVASSLDGFTWSRLPTSPVIRYAGSNIRGMRDPFVTEIGPGDYRMVVVGRTEAAGPDWMTGGFWMARSSDLQTWSKPERLYLPGNINVPECPDLFRLGDRYYLVGSPGIHRVGPGQYRVGSSPGGPWSFASTSHIDSQDFPAPNSASDGKRRLAWAWVPTYAERRDFRDSQWGGHLTFPRELYVGAEGELHTRAPVELEALRGGKLHPREDGEALTLEGAWREQKGLYSTAAGADFARAWVPGNYTRFEFNTTITLGEDCREAGVVFRSGKAFTGYEVAVDAHGQMMKFRRHTDRARVLSSTPIKIVRGRPMKLRVFVDGDVVEAFLDDRFSLTGRAHSFPEEESTRVGLFTDGGSFAAGDVAVYDLKRIYSQEEPATKDFDLKPTGKQGSIVFPRPFANAYAGQSDVFEFSGSFTLECWFRTTPGTGSYKRNLITKSSGDRDFHYGLNISRSNALEIYVLTEKGFVGLTSPPDSVVEEDVWVHAVAVADVEKRELRLYKDGKLIASQSNVDPRPARNHRGALRLGFGAGTPTRDAFIGAMDGVRIWGRALSSEEIMSRADDAVSTDSLVADWQFNEPAQSGRFKSAVGGPSLQLYDGATVFADNAPASRNRP